MERIPVLVKTLLTPDAFDTYTRPGGKPVVVRGWMQSWPAFTKWTFAFFKEQFGEDQVGLATTALSPETEVQTTLSAYIDYLCDENGAAFLHKEHSRLNAQEPFYCTSYKPFQAHPKLRDDVMLPPFALDWWPYLNEVFAANHFPYNQGWVLLSQRGSISQMHIDSHHTITELAQIFGRKEAFLFAPEDSGNVYDGAVDPSAPDYQEFPNLRNAKCHHCILEPGDILFFPPDWWHHVLTLEPSITFSQNLINHTNFGLYIRSALKGNLPSFLATLPADGIYHQPNAATAE